MRLLRRFIKRLRGEISLETLVRRGLKIGKNCSIMEQVTLDPSVCWLIEIGDDVTIAPGVRVFAHDASMHRALGYGRIAPVKIGRGTFIGANSIILPGVTIGKNCVIGAGSIVAADIPDGIVAAGNPCKPIITTFDFIEKHRSRLKNSPTFDESYTIQRGVNEGKKAEMQKKLKGKSGYLR
jgi:maltose O-acetyltransferase